MAFTYDTSTNRGKCRLAIGDVTSGSGILPGGTNFTDAEVDVAISIAGNWQMAAVFLLRAAASQWSAKAAALSVGDYAETRRQVEHLTALADRLEARLPGGWAGMGLGTATADKITDISAENTPEY
jgi:hypothetical protein